MKHNAPRIALATLVTLSAITTGAFAQTRPAGTTPAYPTKPIRMIVPAAAGGSGDIFVRTMAQKFSESMGQPAVVENRAGAALIIGTDLLAKAAPDGYTLGMLQSTSMVLNPGMYSKLPYDPLKDFAPISQCTYYGYVLVVNSSSPAKTLQDIIAMAKAKPGSIAYGSAGTGSANHLAGEFFAMSTNTSMTHVPYKGSAVALGDVLGGQLPMLFDTLITSMPMLKAGKLRPLAYTGLRRSSHLPDVPTMDELGLKGFEISAWQGLGAPAGTSRTIIDKLHAETLKALKLPDVIERLAVQGGNELIGSTPEQFAELIKTEIVQYGRIIKQANIKAE